MAKTPNNEDNPSPLANGPIQLADPSAIARAFGGDTSGAPQNTVTSIGQLLDLYIIHFIFVILFIIGAGILMDRYGNSVSKPYTAWDDIFFALGAVALLINAAFFIALPIAWATNREPTFGRETGSLHWLHGLSIAAAAAGVVWGILALILTFGSTLTVSPTDNTEVAGYFMIILTTAYFLYLCIRYLAGLAGEGKPSDIKGATVSNDIKALFAGIGASRGTAGTSAQPLFGGIGGSAAFGGIDLGGLQASSMSTLPPVQAAHTAAQPCSPQVPMMIIPPVMMAPQAGCQTDPTKVYLG